MSARRGIVSGLIIAASVAALAGAGPTAEAFGRSGKINRETVKYNDLDLREKRDMKRLLWRIRRAAVRVCGGNSGTPRAYVRRTHRSYRNCVDESIDRALDALAKSLDTRAEAALTKGDLPAADDLHRRAVTMHEVLEDNEGVVKHLERLSVVALKRGDLNTAGQCHERALALNKELGRKKDALGNLDRLGWIARTRGDSEAAETWYRQALALSAELDSPKDMANQIRNLGVVAWSRGDLDSAEALHRSALALHQDAGRKESMAESLASLGQIARSRGDLDSARAFHNRALAISAELGNKEGMAVQHRNLWTLALEQNRLDEAEGHLRRSVRLSREAGVTADLPAVGEVQMGLIRLARGDRANACAAWGRAQLLYRQTGNEFEAGRLREMMKDSLCHGGGRKPELTAALQP